MPKCAMQVHTRISLECTETVLTKTKKPHFDQIINNEDIKVEVFGQDAMLENSRSIGILRTNSLTVCRTLEKFEFHLFANLMRMILTEDWNFVN